MLTHREKANAAQTAYRERHPGRARAIAERQREKWKAQPRMSILDAVTGQEGRFWANVDRRGPGECWLWTGETRGGYGVFRRKGRYYGAHRIAFALENDDPGEMKVCHKCDNPPCCNPAHHFAGTNRDNVLDAEAKGRRPRRYGGISHFAVLNEEQARRAYFDPRPAPQIARELGVATTTVHAIRNRETWPHLDLPPLRRSSKGKLL